MSKTVVFDFDGVINSYTSGWCGETNIPDQPVPGIDAALKEIHDAGYEIAVVSSRCNSDDGMNAILEWLKKYNLDSYIDKVCKEKPPAIVYIDDRAICFDGHPETLLKKIQKFHPWNKPSKLTLKELEDIIDQLKSCDYQCEAGPLYMNEAFIQLEKSIEK